MMCAQICEFEMETQKDLVFGIRFFEAVKRTDAEQERIALDP